MRNIVLKVGSPGGLKAQRFIKRLQVGLPTGELNSKEKLKSKSLSNFDLTILKTPIIMGVFLYNYK